MPQSGTNSGGYTPFPDVPSIDELPALPDGGGVALVTPFRVAAEEVAAWLDGIERVDELPPDSSGVAFMRYGNGYYGVPFCESPGDGVECFPVGPGPDDDPFGFSCVCVGSGEPAELAGSLAAGDVARLQTSVKPRCRVHRVNANFVECQNNPRPGCLGRCRLVQVPDVFAPPTASSGGRAIAAARRIILACICGAA